jgi:hypothetical protein
LSETSLVRSPEPEEAGEPLSLYVALTMALHNCQCHNEYMLHSNFQYNGLVEGKVRTIRKIRRNPPAHCFRCQGT